MKKTEKKVKSRKQTNRQETDTSVSKVQQQLNLIEINALKTKLEKHEHLIKELEHTNSQYKNLYENEVKDKEDILSHMKRTMDNLTTEILHLHEKVIGLQNSHQLEKDNLESKLIASETEYKKTLENLKEENLTLKGKLTTLEEFERQKDELYRKYEELKIKYNEEMKDYEEKISHLQRQSVLEYDSLKKECEAKQEVTKDYHFTDEHTAHIIKTAIKETKTLKNLLSDTSIMTSKLYKESDELKHHNSILKQKLNIFESTENKLSSKIEMQNKMINILKKKCIYQEEALDKLKMIEKSYLKLQKKEEISNIQVKKLNDNLKSMASNISVLNKQLELYKTKLKKEETSNVNLIIIILESAKIIKEGMMFMPINKDDDIIYSEQGKKILNQLLLILEKGTEFYNSYYIELLNHHGISHEELQRDQESNVDYISKVETSNKEKENYKEKSYPKQEENQKSINLQLRELSILSNVGLLTSYKEVSKYFKKLHN